MRFCLRNISELPISLHYYTLIRGKKKRLLKKELYSLVYAWLCVALISVTRDDNKQRFRAIATSLTRLVLAITYIIKINGSVKQTTMISSSLARRIFLSGSAFQPKIGAGNSCHGLSSMIIC